MQFWHFFSNLKVKWPNSCLSFTDVKYISKTFLNFPRRIHPCMHACTNRNARVHYPIKGKRYSSISLDTPTRCFVSSWSKMIEEGSRNFKFYSLIGTINLINLPDMMSLSATGRLHNATEYCIKARKTVQVTMSRIMVRSRFDARSPLCLWCLRDFQVECGTAFCLTHQLADFLLRLAPE